MEVMERCTKTAGAPLAAGISETQRKHKLASLTKKETARGYGFVVLTAATVGKLKHSVDGATQASPVSARSTPKGPGRRAAAVFSRPHRI
jgi:hypothetical protein